MTSKKSSVKTFGFTFWRTIRKTCWLPVVFFAVSLFVHTVPIIELARNEMNFERIGLQQLDYILINSNDDISSILFSYSMYVVPVALAFLIFRYMMNKSAVNVYFSLGVSRSTMFLSKFAAGCVMLIASVSIPLVISAFLNVAILGSGSNMWVCFAYLLLNYILFVLNVFAVTSLLFALVGTSFEALVYTVVALASPIMLYLFADYLASEYLVGSEFYKVPWATTANHIYVIDEGYIFGGVNILNKIYPLILFPLSPEFKGMNYVQDANPHYDFWGTACWIIPVAAVSVFAWLAYKKRKTEICGFMGSNAFVTCAAVFIVSAFVSTYVLDGIVTITSKLVVLLVAVVIFTFIYLFVNIISYRNFKKAFGKIWRLGAMLGVYFLIIAATAIFSFGYKSKVPDIEKIKSVSIETETGDIFLESNGGDLYKLSIVTSYEKYATVYPMNILSNEMDDHTAVSKFTSKADIERAVSVHKKLIDCSNVSFNNKNVFASHNERLVPVSVSVIYELKDGSRFMRTFYTADNEILSQLAEFTKSDRYTDLAKKHLLSDDASNQNDYVPYFNIKHSDIAFASPNLSKVTEMPDYKGDGNFNMIFAEALCKDIDEGTFSLDFRNDSELIGYVIFNNMYQMIGGHYAGSHTGYNGETIVDFPDGRTIAITDGMDINEYSPLYSMQSEYTKAVPVYKNMKNVVALLEANGYMSLFENQKKPVEIKLWDYQYINPDKRWIYYKGSTMLFSGAWFSGTFKADDFYGDYVVLPDMPEGSKTVTNPTQMAEIEKDLRLVYLTCYDGSYVQVKYDDGSVVCGYLPK